MQRLLDESDSYADLLEKLDMSPHGANRVTLRKAINDFDLDLTKIAENRSKKNKEQLEKLRSGKRMSLEDVLQNKEKVKTNRLRDMLINAGYKVYKCECCGIDNWMGKPITLQLHHRNGNHNDNSLENLEILCPNCHSQTDTFAGRNVKRKPPVIKKGDEKKKALRGISEDGLRLYDGYGDYKELCPCCKKNFKSREAQVCLACYKKEQKKPKIQKEELERLLKENKYIFKRVAKILGTEPDTISSWYNYYFEKDISLIEKRISREQLKERIRTESFTSIGEDFGVNGNSVKKWCINYNLPSRKKDINKYTDEEWEKI